MDEKFSTIQSELVQLGSRKKPSKIVQKISAGPVADKFFVVGALGAVLGMAGYGAYLWLALNAQLSLPQAYPALKQMHGKIQFFLFFAPFILGFSFQAGPKMLGVGKRVSPRVLILLPFLVAGAVMEMIYPRSPVSLVGLSVVFLTTACVVCSYGKGRFEQVNMHALFFLLAAQGGFTLAVLVPWSGAGTAAVLFWLAVVPAIFAGGEQFVSSFVSGHRISPKQGKAFRYVYAVSALLGICCLFTSSTWVWRIWACSTIAAILFYGYAVGVWRINFKSFANPLLLGIVFAFIWALAGSFVLVCLGLPYVDFVLHLWGAGWGATLILVVSAQIMGHLSGQPLYQTRTALALCLIWQLVPFGRGLLHVLHNSAGFSWLLGASSALVLGVWCFQLVQAELRIIRAQFQLSAGERVGSC